MARKLLFVTPEISESEGILVQLRSLDPKVITPRDKFIATYDGKDLKVRRRFSPQVLQTIFDKTTQILQRIAATLVPGLSEAMGTVMTELTLYTDEITESDWNLTEERFCNAETGADVTEHKADFLWMKENPAGERSEASLTASDRINIVKRVSLDTLTKNIMPENTYLMYCWHGDKKTPIKYYTESVTKLRELADDMASKHEGGLCSFTWGN